MQKILLVDDSKTVRMLLGKILADGGYQVLEAADGKAAIQLLKLHSLDMIVTDIYMPDGDGIELLTAIRGMEKRPPIVAMSSKTGDMDMLHTAKLLGAVVTLHKPFAPIELLRWAKELLTAEPAHA